MKYVHVPTELSISEIRSGGACFSPGRYVRFIPPKSSSASWFVSLDKLVVLRNSQVAVEKSEWYHYAEIGDIDVTTGGVTFRKMRGYQLPTRNPQIAELGDVLVSTVRTYRKGIGYVSSGEGNLVTTSAVLNICRVTDYVPYLTLLYVYSFLCSDFFVEQVWSMLNRGVYPRMDTGALDKIFVPIASDSRVIRYVSALAQAIIDKETVIRERSDSIHNAIQFELENNQKNHKFRYEYPHTSEIRQLGRLDAAIYSDEYKSKIWLIENYAHGYVTPASDGFAVIPGPSLEIKLLGTRLDSDVYKPGFYALILPTNISVYGTMNVISYLGTGKKLPLLQQGDIVFGEAGFQKGRSIVLLEGIENCTTNAHGLYARRTDGDTQKSIFFRCVFNWYRSMRLIDLMAVGGSGGHFSPEYFDYIRIPKFPDSKRADIARLYHNPAPPSDTPTLDTFVDWHRCWNAELGIWELDREMKALQRTLAEVQEKIIEGKTVQVPI
jgi:hypothetical protein